MTYREWATELLGMPIETDVLADARIRKALDISLSMSVTRSHADELLVSRWSVEMHMFITSWESSLPS